MKYDLQEIKELFSDWTAGLIFANERDFEEAFKKALDTNKIENLEPFLKFISNEDSSLCMRKLSLNYRTYYEGLNFGFTEILFNDYFWLDNVAWSKTDEVVFKEKKGYLQNKVSLAQGKNGKWCYSLHYGSAFSGGGYACSVFCTAYETYDEALISGIKDLLGKLSRMEESNSLKEVKAGAQYKLSQLTKINENNQLSIF